MEPSPSSLPDFIDFLNRMRHPASADLMRSINRFIVSCSLYPTNAGNDSRKLQDFLLKMETTIRKHPMWVHAANAEIENAFEAVEKYIMIKLFSRVFAASPEDAEADLRVSKKILSLQHFVKPDHLDMPGNFQTEASWLYAAKRIEDDECFQIPSSEASLHHELLPCH